MWKDLSWTFWTRQESSSDFTELPPAVAVGVALPARSLPSDASRCLPPASDPGLACSLVPGLPDFYFTPCLGPRLGRKPWDVSFERSQGPDSSSPLGPSWRLLALTSHRRERQRGPSNLLEPVTVLQPVLQPVRCRPSFSLPFPTPMPMPCRFRDCWFVPACFHFGVMGILYRLVLP